MMGTKLKWAVLILLLLSVGVVLYQFITHPQLLSQLSSTSDSSPQEQTQPQEEGVAAEPEIHDVFCTQNFAPVCGNLKGVQKSFPNECEAQKAGALNIQAGLCAPLDTCPTEKDPVCGTVSDQKRSFDNLCVAEAAGATDIQSGNCPTPALTLEDLAPPCPDTESPVCGTVEGQNAEFKNECLAQKAKAIDITPGACVNTPAANLNSGT